MNKIITLRHNDTSIAFDTSAVMWSLTDLWRAAGSPENREPWNWLRKEGKRYLIALERNLTHSQVSQNEAPESDLTVSQVESEPTVRRFESEVAHSQVSQNEAPERNLVSGEVDVIVTRRGGTGGGGGTWAHQLAGLEYARYLSPELSIACNQFILDYWRGKQEQPDWGVLEQRIAALEQASRQAAEDTITITISLTSRQRLEVIRELGGVVSPKQLYTELKQRGHNVDYHKVLRWLHSLAKGGRLKHRHRGRYELHDK